MQAASRSQKRQENGSPLEPPGGTQLCPGSTASTPLWLLTGSILFDDWSFEWEISVSLSLSLLSSPVLPFFEGLLFIPNELKCYDNL